MWQALAAAAMQAATSEGGQGGSDTIQPTASGGTLGPHSVVYSRGTPSWVWIVLALLVLVWLKRRR